MARQRVHGLGRIHICQIARGEQAGGAGRIASGLRQVQAVARRLVQHQRDGLDGLEVGATLQGHRLFRSHTGARRVLHLAIHGDKTRVDVVLGLGARAADLVGQAFGQADGVRIGVLVVEGHGAAGVQDGV
ncbi:hypothetical protein D3C72_1063100 [compost metagenome]